MKHTTHETIVLPQGEEGRKLLERLINAPDAKQAWDDAHETHGGPSIVIEESDPTDPSSSKHPAYWERRKAEAKDRKRRDQEIKRQANDERHERDAEARERFHNPQWTME